MSMPFEEAFQTDIEPTPPIRLASPAPSICPSANPPAVRRAAQAFQPCQAPPRAVRTPRSFKTEAMTRAVVAPAATP
jgi:hypothetical protein